ncbi:MAG: SigB/SigF/SigG family RNA polymerase sigma factor [Lachnospiraceae bacterium]|nr:SigB/SigF/SigG family RNA polymerase sigma factor [Lachnospiraceae bacterium]
MNERVRDMILLAQKGDEGAKGLIIKENAGLIWSIVRRFRERGADAEDLFQIGAIGLLKCIEKFDMSYNVEFSTYAVPMIMGEIKRFLRDDGMIKISRPLKELNIRARYMQEELLKKNGEAPSLSTLADALGVRRDVLLEALEAGRDIESINRTVYQNDGSGIFLVDKLACRDDDEERRVDIIALREVVAALPENERRIIKMRYFSDRTQADIAGEIGISQVQVSRIEKKAKETIRRNMA